MKIELAVRHLGHVPSKKNNKMLARGRLITDPKKQEWMERCIQSFELQLFCATQMAGAGTTITPIPHSLIASSLPLDDSRQWISETHIYTEEVPKGMEGAYILIEPI